MVREADQGDVLTVYIIVGWFGDIEWIEEIHSNEHVAEARVRELWETRNSARGPEWASGLHKFGIEDWEVIG
jgi:hypothetical protein